MLLSPNINTYRSTAPELKHYQGAYDALATFAALRDAKVLGNYSYLHLAPGQAEIGWAPIEHLRLLTGEPCVDWRRKLGYFGKRAEQLGSKAFGYIGFDAVDGHAGTLPDRSLSRRPLVEFVIPGEIVQFAGSQVTQRSQRGLDLHRYITANMPPPRPPSRGGPFFFHVAATPEQVFVDAVRKGTSAL